MNEKEWIAFLASSHQWKDRYTLDEFNRMVPNNLDLKIVTVLWRWAQQWDPDLFINYWGRAVRIWEGRATIVTAKMARRIIHTCRDLMCLYHNRVHSFRTTNLILVQRLAGALQIEIYAEPSVRLHPNEYRKRAWLAWYHGSLRVLPKHLFRTICRRFLT